jgi:hypothetical protein
LASTPRRRAGTEVDSGHRHLAAVFGQPFQQFGVRGIADGRPSGVAQAASLLDVPQEQRLAVAFRPAWARNRSEGPLKISWFGRNDGVAFTNEEGVRIHVKVEDVTMGTARAR